MLNEFLSHMLQVIIVLDVVGIVAWFVLKAKRSPQKAVAVDHEMPGPAAKMTLWSKLTGSRQQLQPARAQAKGKSLDDALGQLRRVLESYRGSLT